MFFIVIAVVIWGSMFVVTKSVLEIQTVDPVGFIALRFIVAAICFVPVMGARKNRNAWTGKALAPAIIGASFLSAAYFSQTFGIRATTIPNAAFLSSAYVLFAPLLTILVLKNRVLRNEWVGALFSIVGATVLTGFSVSISATAATLLLTCSFFYACQITSVAGRDRSVSSAVFTGQQMLGVAIVSTLIWLIWTPISPEGFRPDGFTDWRFIAGVIYAGVVGSAVAFWLQTVGQNKVSATQTAIIFAMEPFFAIAVSTLFSNPAPDLAAWLGGALIVVGVVVSNLSPREGGGDDDPQLQPAYTSSDPDSGPLTQTSVSPPPTRSVKTLILKGGGVKGLALAGAITELDKHGYRFSTYVGTSAGAVGATLLAAGYTPGELRSRLTDTNLRKFMDANPLSRVINFLAKGGLYPGLGLKKWVEASLRMKFADVARTPDIKMRTLLAEKGNRAIVFASHPKLGALTFDSDGENADVSVNHAVRLSSTIPGFFVPEMQDGSRIYDGGLLHNFPIEIYKKITSEQDDFLAIYIGRPIKETGKKLWFMEALEIMLARDDTANLRDYRDRCIVIDTSPIETTDFEVEEKEKSFLFEAGRLSAMEFLGQRGAEIERLRTTVADLREAARSRVERTRLNRRLQIFVASFLCGAMLTAAGFAVAEFGPKAQFTEKSDVKYSRSYISSSGESTPLGCSARAEIDEFLDNYPLSMEDDAFKLDSIVQLVYTGDQESAKLVVADGRYQSGVASKIRFSSSTDPHNSLPLSEVKILSPGDEGWVEAWRCSKNQRTILDEESGKKEYEIDLRQCLGDGARFRMVGLASYGDIWRRDGSEQAVEPWILFAHRFLKEAGKAIYLMLDDGSGVVNYPERVYVKTSEDIFTELRVPRRSSGTLALWSQFGQHLSGAEDARALFSPNVRKTLDTVLGRWRDAEAARKSQIKRDFLFALDASKTKKLGERLADTNLIVFAEHSDFKTEDDCTGIRSRD